MVFWTRTGTLVERLTSHYYVHLLLILYKFMVFHYGYRKHFLGVIKEIILSKKLFFHKYRSVTFVDLKILVLKKIIDITIL